MVIAANAQTEVTIKDENLEGDTHWTADNVYLLDGFVYLEEGTLTIDPGTVIKAKAETTTGDNASALIITRDAKIMAQGTPELPIIFTSELDDLEDPTDLTHEDRGLWGGVILLGYGVLGDESTENSIEGIPEGDDRAKYGGDDDTHNAGVMKYISIRHGGAEIGAGNEINGLSVAGVGSETVLENIEIFANKDDGFEFWGGTVSAKHLIAAFCGDDAFDYDDGWHGNGQFWFAIQDSEEAGSAGEHDGAHPDGNDRFSNPNIYNVTYIGPGVDSDNSDVAIMFRDGTGGTYANSIITDFPAAAVEVEDNPEDKGTDSRLRMEQGHLNIMNNIWYGFGGGDDFVANELIQVTVDDDGNVIAEDPTAAFLVDHITSNNNIVADPMISSISREPNGQLDPRPHPLSPAWTNGYTKSATDNHGIEEVDYKGAFGRENWARMWTALDAMGYFGDVFVSANEINVNGFRLHQNYPNPANGTTTIEYTLSESARVKLSIYDITGKMVRNVVHENQFKGDHSVTVNGLKQGIYFYQLIAGENRDTKKMIIK